ncbi:hypothetical protein H0H93_000502, partial [Arthromyces matolae]
NIGALQSFTYAEYEAVALTKVWSGTALLPSQDELWRQQKARVEELGGYGRHFQFVPNEKADGWLNNAAFRFGGRTVNGLSPELPEISKVWSKSRFGSDIFEGRVNLTSHHHSYTSGLDDDLIALYNDLY